MDTLAGGGRKAYSGATGPEYDSNVRSGMTVLPDELVLRVLALLDIPDLLAISRVSSYPRQGRA